MVYTIDVLSVCLAGGTWLYLQASVGSVMLLSSNPLTNLCACLQPTCSLLLGIVLGIHVIGRSKQAQVNNV